MIGLLLLATVYVGTIGDLLEYGAPSASDVIAARKGYVVGFNDKTHCPDWTVHRLRAEQLMGAKVKRSDDFRHDAQIPRSAELSDYKGSGWARGHMVPAADMSWSQKAMSDTFLLSNIIPQDTRNNSGAWNRIEQLVRKWGEREKKLTIVTGPIYDTTKPPRTIGATGVRVPDAIFKAVLDETPPRKMIAFIAPNADDELAGTLLTQRSTRSPARRSTLRPRELAVSVDEVERRTGLDLFSKLPKSEQDKLESMVDVDIWYN